MSVETQSFVHNPTHKQFLALEYLYDKQTEFLLFGGAAGGGKSWLGCEWLISMCLNFPETGWFIARKTLKTLKRTTLRTFFKVAKHHKVSHLFDYRDQQSLIQCHNGSFIDLLEVKYQPSDPDYEDLGSAEYTGGMMEELAEIPYKAYEVLSVRIGRLLNDKYGILGKIYGSCNPRKNWLKRLVYDPWVKGELPNNMAFVQSLYRDNPYVEKDYERKLSNIKDRSLRERLKEGNWNYDDSDDQLCDYDAILNCFTNRFVLPGEKCITVDVALHGSDMFRLWVWDGFRAEHLYEIEKCDAKVAEEFIRVRANYHQIPLRKIIYDADGLGTYLRGYMKTAIPFVNNGRAVKVKGQAENYMNLATQCTYNMAHRINSNGYFINAEEWEKDMISEELSQAKRAKSDDEGKLRILDKKSIKENIGRSPDYLDVCKMREYLELIKTGKMRVV